MTYAGNQTAIATFTTNVYGSQCQNVLEWGTEDAGNFTSPSNIADYIVTNIVPAWIAFLSDEVTLEKIYVETTHPTGVPPQAPATRFINTPGVIVSESLPPHDAARLYKTPGNVVIEGTLTNPFRIGMMRIAGIPETYQANGIAEGTLISGLNTLKNQLLQLVDVPNFVAGTVTYDLIMVRRDHTTQEFGLTKVTNMTPGTIIGTQNTRKIGR